ncbi:MAG: hypothetical protein PHU06_11770 [Gallionella sp.]|nr:hypothetical protein [Gallionella sp.]
MFELQPSFSPLHHAKEHDDYDNGYCIEYFPHLQHDSRKQASKEVLIKDVRPEFVEG